MGNTDKASLHYGIGLAALSIVQICMAHGLFDNPNQLKGTELTADGADLSPYTELAAEAGNGLIRLGGIIVMLVTCIILSAVVMLLLRLLLRDRFEQQTVRRGVICAGVSFAVCLIAGLIFGGIRETGTALLLSLPVPAVSWPVYHLGRTAENTQNPPSQP